MPTRCARSGSSATRTCSGNSGVAEAVRIKIQLHQHKGLAHDIEAALAGSICIGSIREQIEAHHGVRLSLDVALTAARFLPERVREAVLSDILAPLGYIAMRPPEAIPGDAMSALAAVGAEVGDVHRVVPMPVSREQKLREIEEAIHALERVAAVLL